MTSGPPPGPVHRARPPGAFTSPAPLVRRALAPGRVNLIGDHTDYNGGLALPMAVDLATEVQMTQSSSKDILLYSSLDPLPSAVAADIPFDADLFEDIEPPWARMAAAVIAQAHPPSGGVVRVTSTLPTGAGLSSSGAFCLALMLALGVEGDPVLLARMCQRAEAAAGADVGLMDYLASAAAVAGSALLIDFATLVTTAVPLGEDLDVVVVHSGIRRTLATTPYAARRAECDAASVELGIPLGRAEEADIPGIIDPLLRRRTRHVVTESRRVRQFAAALTCGDAVQAGWLMTESHASLAGDFEASHPAVDHLVATLGAAPGVYGARMTGGGFGGCVVALAASGSVDPARWDRGAGAWTFRPAGPATATFVGVPPAPA